MISMETRVLQTKLLKGDGLARIERDHVLLAGVIRVSVGAADAREYRMLFHVHVHRMHPATASVRDRPQLAVAAALRKGDRCGGIELQAVDDPLGLPAGRAILSRSPTGCRYG